jgi:hypothetical protein
MLPGATRSAVEYVQTSKVRLVCRARQPRCGSRGVAPGNTRVERGFIRLSASRVLFGPLGF